MESDSGKEESPDTWSDRVSVALHKKTLESPDSLVFEGGGVLGTAYPAALRVASERGVLDNVRNFGGASVGALTAGILACGADIDFLERQIDSTDYSALFDTSFGLLRDVYRFYSRGGYARGAALRAHVEKCLSDLTGDAYLTFADVERRFGNNLSVVTTSMSERRLLVFDARRTPQQPIADALIASSSFPLVFPLVDYRDAASGRLHRLWDGGLLNNFPIQLFDEQRTATPEEPHERWPNRRGTIGLKLMLPDEKSPGGAALPPQYHEIDNVFGAVRGLLSCWSDASARVHVNEAIDWPRTLPIRIPLPVSAMDFSLSDETKEILKRAGRESAKQYFNSLK